jgi:hypothetical protein
VSWGVPGGAIAAAILLSAPAWAQTAPAAAPQLATPFAAPMEPARLAAAERVVAVLVPEGVYQRMLGQNFSQMMSAMTDSIGSMPAQRLVQLTGLPEEDVAKLGEATVDEVLAIFDPHWHERMTGATDAVGGVMSRMMTKVEPAIRAALARAYAREFNAAELAEMQRFFASPAGAHYAAKSIEIMWDPEMIKAMADMAPQMMEQMPELTAELAAAQKTLPEPRKFKDLTPEEQKRAAALLGVDPADLLAASEALETM